MKHIMKFIATIFVCMLAMIVFIISIRISNELVMHFTTEKYSGIIEINKNFPDDFLIPEDFPIAVYINGKISVLLWKQLKKFKELKRLNEITLFSPIDTKKSISINGETFIKVDNNKIITVITESVAYVNVTSKYKVENQSLKKISFHRFIFGDIFFVLILSFPILIFMALIFFLFAVIMEHIFKIPLISMIQYIAKLIR